MRVLNLVFVAIIAAVSGTGVAQAGPVVWTLSDVTLSDGTSITGSFTVDVDLPIPSRGLTDYDIVVSGGSTMLDFTYTPSDPFSQLFLYSFNGPSGLPLERLNAFRGRSPNGTALELLYLDPSAFLTDAGGIVPLDLANSSGQLWNGEIAYATVRAVSGSFVGTPASTPEPPSFILLLGGISVAGAFAWQRRRPTLSFRP